MQLEIFKPSESTPAKWNHEALKAAVAERMTSYKGVVYTEETQSQAKKDRATLNKLIAAIDDFLKDERKKALAGFEVTKRQAEEIKAIIIPCRDEIDAQDKRFTEFRKAEKQEFIVEQLYKPLIGNLAELVPYERLHNPKWLNVTTSVSDIGDELARTVEKIESGLKAIDQLNLEADIAERVKSVFLRNFDLAAAIAEKEHLEKQRALLRQYEEAEREAANTAQAARVAPAEPQAISAPAKEEQPTQPAQRPEAEEKLLTVAFRIHVTKAQLDGLGAYMKANGIKPERV